MKQTKKDYEERLNAVKNEYNDRFDTLKNMISYENNIRCTSCFETNLIIVLTHMIELKSKMRELERMITLWEVNNYENN